MLLEKGCYGAHQKSLLEFASLKPQKLWDAVNRNTLWEDVNELTHVHDHVSQTYTDLINTLYDGNEKDVVSTFSNDATMKLCIEEAITLYAEEIAIWLSNSHDFTEPAELRFEMGDDEWDDYPDIQPKGHGVIRNRKNNTVAAYQTNIYSVILTKTPPHIYSEYGFTVRTAYPNLTQYGAEPTGTDLRDALYKTQKYKNANPIEKAYLEHCYTPNQTIKANYHDHPANPGINIPIPSTNPLIRHNCKVTEFSRTVRTYQQDVFTNVPDNEALEIIQSAPEHAKVIQNLQQNIKALSEEERGLTQPRREPQVSKQTSTTTNTPDY